MPRAQREEVIMSIDFSRFLNKWIFSESFFDEIPDGALISFVNPFSITEVSDSDLAMAGIDYWGVDGSLLVFILSVLGVVSVRRVSFDYSSVAKKFFLELNGNSKTLAIVGADELSNNLFVSLLKKQYENINIVYARNGYFDGESELEECRKSILKLSPDYVLCGMGARKQEEFLIDLKASGWRGVGITCGGFIHQTAKAKGVYYPKLIDRLNLRFVYRMYDEPKLVKRYFFSYPISVVKIIFSVVRYHGF